jgi:hypothetical protein
MATRTHTRITPADPFLVCDACGCKIDYWWTDGPPINFPCEHHAGYKNRCPSWGPVDGCSCMAFLGYVPHPPAEAIPRSSKGQR